jgi:hypothetical protein
MDRQQLRSELRKEGLLGRDRGTLHVSNASLQLKLDGRYCALGVREDDGFLAITETLRTTASHSQSISEPCGDEAVAQLVMADKREEDASEATVNSRYIRVLRRMYEHPSAQPWSVESIRDALEPMSPLAKTRRQIVPFLRDLAGRLGVRWDPVLDKSANRGKKITRREKDYYSDERVEAMLRLDLEPEWRLVLLMLSVFGLRPLEVTVAEPCRQREGMLWIPVGKKSSRGINPPRSVPLYHPQWLEQHGFWNLMRTTKLPESLRRNPRQAGSGINKAFETPRSRRAGEGGEFFDCGELMW